MFRYLEQLRREPLEVRRRAAVGLTIVVFAVVILIWLGIIGMRSFFMPFVDSGEPLKDTGGIQAPY